MSETQIKADADEEEKEPARRIDPELRVMGAILRLLEEMGPLPRRRVVDYLSSRYKEESWPP
jgi:hypothetical protein